MSLLCQDLFAMDTSKKKLIPKKIGAAGIDTVAARKKRLTGEKDVNLIEYVRQCWMDMSEAREHRERNYRMAYGDQWGDLITVIVDGHEKTMTMRDYITMDGMIPMQTNQIASQINTLVGVFVKEQNEPVCNARDRDEQQYGELLTITLQANNTSNEIEKIHKACVSDVIVGGMAIAREHYGYREGGSRRIDAWTSYIDPNYFIMDTTMRDPRGWDMSMVGVWQELTPVQFNKRFVHNKEQYEKYNEIYDGNGDEYTTSGIAFTDKKDLSNVSFMKPSKPGNRCVAEIWTLESRECVRMHDWNEGSEDIIELSDKETLAYIEQINKERKVLAMEQGIPGDQVPLIEATEYFVDDYWYCRFLAPDGTIIDEYESPYADKQHPFIIMTIPFVDGRISGYITDAIDHQIAMNRAIILQDWIVRNQIKGLVMIPEQLVPETMSKEEFVNAMSIGNFLFFDAERAKGYKPEVFHTAAVNYDATTFISQMKTLMESSTAVSGAIQGKTPYSGTSAALYAQQTANSATPIASLLSDIRRFMIGIANKKAKNIAKNYDIDRFRIIAGAMADVFGNANMNLAKIEDFEFDIEIKESTETPVYRAIQNDQLMAFWQAGAIDLQTMLEVGNFAFGDRLLQKIQARQAEVEAAKEGEMGQAEQQAAQQIEDTTQTKGYGLPVNSTREIVNPGL